MCYLVSLQFIMIGSGNPQEGELRPQLLDRFGLSVNVSTLQDTDTRVELVMSRMQYEAASLLSRGASGALLSLLSLPVLPPSSAPGVLPANAFGVHLLL